MTFMGCVFFVLVAGFILATLFSILAGNGLEVSGFRKGEILNPRLAKGDRPPPAPVASKAGFSVLSWNIGWAYGMGSDGLGYQPRKRAHFETNIEKIAKVISDASPDIVFLQEVDFESDRTERLDQLERLRERLAPGYFAAPLIDWRALYVPFPYFPLKAHFGRVKAGAAVLSKFPITTNEVFLFPKFWKRTFWMNAFFPFRFFQIVEFEISGQKLAAIHLHLDAYRIAFRKTQSQHVLREFENWNHTHPQSPIGFIAGDFNCVPERALKKTDFPDLAKCDDYEGDSTLRRFSELTHFSNSVPELEYAKNEKRYFTFSTAEPDRTIDHLYYDKRLLTVANHEVIRRPEVEASDHFPILIRLQFPKGE